MPILPRMTAFALLLFAGEAAAACKDYVPGQRPQNTAREDVGSDFDTIIERGWIEFAVYEDFPPFSFTQDGEQQGVDIEMGRLIAGELGVEPRFMVVAADENVDNDLRNFVWKGPVVNGRVANVMLHVPYNEGLACRNDQVVFTGQYFNERIGIAWDRETYDDAPTPAYFRYDAVGVENDSLADFYLSSAFGGQVRDKVKRFTTYTDAMEALNNGDFGAVVGPLAQLQYGARGNTDRIGLSDMALPGLALGEWTLGVAVRHTYRQLGYAVDDAVQAGLTDGRVAAIFEKYGLIHRTPDW